MLRSLGKVDAICGLPNWVTLLQTVSTTGIALGLTTVLLVKGAMPLALGGWTLVVSGTVMTILPPVMWARRNRDPDTETKRLLEAGAWCTGGMVLALATMVVGELLEKNLLVIMPMVAATTVYLAAGLLKIGRCLLEQAMSESISKLKAE